jgi:hypothetical protein
MALHLLLASETPRMVVLVLDVERDFQEALISVLTDRDLRRRFVADPMAVLAAFDLDDRGRSALARLPVAALSRYAESLLGKRWSQVATVVPLTRRICPSIERRYRGWLATHPARMYAGPLQPGPAEALRALPSLRSVLATDPDEAIYGPELLAYEVFSACARNDGSPRTLVSRFDLRIIVDDLRRGLIPIDPDPTPTWVRFEKGGIRSRPAPGLTP